MSKYRRLRDRVALLAEEWGVSLRSAEPLERADLDLVHEKEYIDRVLGGAMTEVEMRRIGFPWSPQLIDRSLRSAGATLQAARSAHAEGIAVNLAGGTHHAGPARGQGFCVFNDVAIAARSLQATGSARRCVVIDCDVHQGNGTAEIFADDPSVFTLSLHGARNFPFAKTPSDLDVSLPDGTPDEAYLLELARALEQLSWDGIDMAFYLAGADPFHGDRLGRLSLTKPGLAQRDQLVFSRCRAHRVPVAVTMAGGYADDPEDIVDIHAETVRAAASLHPWETPVRTTG